MAKIPKGEREGRGDKSPGRAAPSPDVSPRPSARLQRAMGNQAVQRHAQRTDPRRYKTVFDADIMYQMANELADRRREVNRRIKRHERPGSRGRTVRSDPYRTFAIATVFGPDGRPRFTASGSYVYKGAPHAEEVVLRKLKGRVLPGDTVIWVVDQVPCPGSCSAKLKQFPDQHRISQRVFHVLRGKGSDRTFGRGRGSRAYIPSSPKTQAVTPKGSRHYYEATDYTRVRPRLHHEPERAPSGRGRPGPPAPARAGAGRSSTRSGGSLGASALMAAVVIGEATKTVGEFVQYGNPIKALRSVEDEVDGKRFGNPGKGVVIVLTWRMSYPTGTAKPVLQSSPWKFYGVETFAASTKREGVRVSNMFPNIRERKQYIWVPPLPAELLPPEKSSVRPHDLPLPDVNVLSLYVSSKRLLERGEGLRIGKGTPEYQEKLNRWATDKNRWDTRIAGEIARLHPTWDAALHQELTQLRSGFHEKAAKVLQAQTKSRLVVRSSGPWLVVDAKKPGDSPTARVREGADLVELPGGFTDKEGVVWKKVRVVETGQEGYINQNFYTTRTSGGEP